MGFPRGEFFSSTNEPGNNIVLAQPINQMGDFTVGVNTGV
jgi:hypothetical protein